MRVYVGADWSATEVMCATLADPHQPPRRIGKTGRSVDDVEQLLQRVRQQHGEVDTVTVIIEDGAPGWVELFHHAGAQVYVVDPKQAKSFGESCCSSGAKDDARDSKLLAQMGAARCHRWQPWRPDEPLVAQLRTLCGLHQSRLKLAGAEKQRLRSHLRESFPRLEAVLDDLSRQWVWRLLRLFPTAHHVRELKRPDFDARMQGCGARRTTLDRVWEALSRTRAPWMNSARAGVEALRLRQWVDTIEMLQGQIDQVEEELDALTAELDEREALESVDGIGTKMANRLLSFAFGGKPPEHRDEAAIQMGACPVFKGSGTRRDGTPKGSVHMRRSASSHARATIYLLGRLASQRLSWAKARYKWDMARGKTAAQSYRSIARSLLRILTAIVKSGEPYNDARYVAALKRNGVPWAMELDSNESLASAG